MLLFLALLAQCAVLLPWRLAPIPEAAQNDRSNKCGTVCPVIELEVAQPIRLFLWITAATFVLGPQSFAEGKSARLNTSWNGNAGDERKESR